MMQLGLFSGPEKSRGTDSVPDGYRVAWTYTGWRAAQWPGTHHGPWESRGSARRLYVSRATMVGVGKVWWEQVGTGVDHE